MVNRPQQMSAHPKQILYNTMDGGEPLQMSGRLEAAHLPLALARRLMRDLGAIVFVLPGTVDHGRHHGTMRGRVAAQFVRDQSARLAALSFQSTYSRNSPCLNASTG